MVELMSADQPMTRQAETEGRLVLVDGHAYAYRAFHAIRSLSSPQGEPTNAIFGFIKMVDRLLEVWKPSHLAVVWDGGLAAERVAELPGYKAQRPPMPESLGRQIEAIVEWLKASGMRSLCSAGVEADDWIATLARGLAPEIGQVLIASSDKDFMQLVGDRVGLVNPSESAARIWTAEDVAAKTGVRPEQVADWLSLIGDAVDNIEGVPGIGPKRAAELLRIFGSIDGIFEGLERVESARVRENLQGSQSVIRRNQRLIWLKDAGEHVVASELRMGARDSAALSGLYARWGFRSMLDGLKRPEWLQGDLFGQTA
jgi:DNA polymerase I